MALSDEHECNAITLPEGFTERRDSKTINVMHKPCDGCGEVSELTEGFCYACLKKYLPKDYPDND